MAMKTKVGGKPKDDYDLLFVFDNVQVIVFADPAVYSDEEAKMVEWIIQKLTRHIEIDKSYVDFPENKHQDVFLSERGWTTLCKLMKETKFGAKSGSLIDEVVIETFRMMIAAYLFNVLDLFGYDIDSINIDFPNGSKVNAKFYVDDIQEWKTYPGPWQDWGLEDSEQK